MPRPSGASAPLLACIPGGGCGGRYFEAASLSTAEHAHACGFNVLLVDRPGYGASEPVAGDRPIADSTPRIRSLLRATLSAPGVGRDLVLIGHSIGGAVALMLAAEPDGLPLRAVAVSGIGDEAPRATRDRARAPDGAATTPNLSADQYFGLPGSYGWRGPAALRRVAEPWRMPEVAEIVGDWPREWPRIAGAITLPVHLRLADQDAIWETGDAVVRRMAARLTRSTLVDAALLAGGGHAYEFHLRGPELVFSQLDFLSGWVSAGR